MAIDGIKIIDSDIAHDVYNTVVEQYKDGIELKTILQEVQLGEDDFVHAVDKEIYWTALAFSLWKIGHLDEAIRTKTLATIAQGANPLWREWFDEKNWKQPQKTLDKLATQIAAITPSPSNLSSREKHLCFPIFKWAMCSVSRCRRVMVMGLLCFQRGSNTTQN